RLKKSCISFPESRLISVVAANSGIAGLRLAKTLVLLTALLTFIGGANAQPQATPQPQVTARQPNTLPQSKPASQDISSLSLEDLMKIEVHSVYGASRFLQKVSEAPGSVSIITADEIKRYGYLTLADAIRSVRGFYVNYTRS